ncbi:unnamed protein product [Staurois parvus]|uniref:Uncharacterized protein n=1 Tax=Staurois parvus TaxID=386267 RepID=A0ABN9D6N2_9NEOB|nr:unnamed protein product [Staurois parvus]
MTLAIPSDEVCSDSHLVPDFGLNSLPSKHLNLRKGLRTTQRRLLSADLSRAPAVLSGPPTSTPTGNLCNFGPDSHCPTLRGVRNLAAREALSPLACITRYVINVITARPNSQSLHTWKEDHVKVEALSAVMNIYLTHCINS